MDGAGRPLVAAATVFVSHAWRYRFVDLVAALMARFDGAPHAHEVYLWNGEPFRRGLPGAAPRRQRDGAYRKPPRARSMLRLIHTCVPAL